MYDVSCTMRRMRTAAGDRTRRISRFYEYASTHRTGVDYDTYLQPCTAYAHLAGTPCSRPMPSTALTRRAFAAVVYVSEGRRTAVLDAIEHVAREATASRRVALVNVFRDAEYNRTGFTLAGASVDELRTSALEVAEASLQHLDLRVHDATHPRVGAVDHVSCHALRGERVDAADLARGIGHGLSSLGIPVKLYGDASSDGVGLAELRRKCGYFSGARTGEWTGRFASEEGMFTFDFGPDSLTEKWGFAMVGAVPWVCNYNVPLLFTWEQADVDGAERKQRTLVTARAVAKRVSARGGGLPQVQAMALPHGDCIVEVACNLLDTSISSISDVQQATALIVAETNLCDQLGHGASVKVQEGYVTNQTPESILAAVDRQHKV